MRFAKASTLAVALTAAFITFSGSPETASAENTLFQKTYKVQVEYWFFDTDYYYWSTVFESSDLQDALLVYELLQIAKENHQLNEVAPSSYGRYIAMNVRMITEYSYPDFYKTAYSDLNYANRARLTRK